MYADDTQFYMSFNIEEKQAMLTKMEDYIAEVRQWMAENILKLNDTKIEFLAIS